MVFGMDVGVGVGIDTVLGVDVGFDSKPLDLVTRGAQVFCAAADDPYFHSVYLFELGGSVLEAGTAMVTPTVVW